MEKVKVVIIDVLSADLFYDVNKRMQSIMASNDLFGGVSVVLLGDILQLPPINGQAIFMEHFSEENHALFNLEQF